MGRLSSHSLLERVDQGDQIVDGLFLGFTEACSRFTDEDFPFCSDRCRKIDLGKWAIGVYKISSPVLDPEVLEDLGRGQKEDSYEN